MPRAVSGSASPANGRVTLYVEGCEAIARASRLSRDPHVIRKLLWGLNVEVVPSGGCESVLAMLGAADARGGGVAAGADSHHAIVDRDYRSDSEVAQLWQSGPFAKGRRALAWRRHELENYFLEPDFLLQSRYAKPSADGGRLTSALERRAAERVAVDAANLVIQRIRHEVRAFDVSLLIGALDSRAARDMLVSSPHWQKLKSASKAVLHAKAIGQRYDDTLAELLGGRSKPTMGQGRWLELMFGAELLDAVVCARFFKVLGSSGKPLQGEPLIHEVAADLLASAASLPQDLADVRAYFRALRN